MISWFRRRAESAPLARSLRIAKLQQLAFGKSSEKIECEIEQLELALEDLLVAVAEDDEALIGEGPGKPSPEAGDAPALRRRPRVSDATLRERRELDPDACCPDCGAICVSRQRRAISCAPLVRRVRMSANCRT